MATVSLLPSPVPGHVNPTLAIAGELAGRGHEVTFHLPEEYRAQVEEAGARLRPIRLSAPHGYREHGDPHERFAMFPAWLAEEAEGVLPQVLEHLGGVRPDVVVYDMTCVWGRLLSKLMPGPAALVVASYVSNEHFSLMRNARYLPLHDRFAAAFARIAPLIERLNHAYGLRERPQGLFARDEELVLVLMPRAFHPAGETFGDPFVFVGSCIRPRPGGPDPLLDGLAPDRRTVYISAGTLMDLWPDMVDTVREAFADGAWQVVLSLGGREPAGKLPGNIVARGSVPQLDVLARADAFVTHGGTNSIVEAIDQEVPLVVVPCTPEHEVTGDQVAGLGLGARLDQAGLTPDGLRAAVEEVSASASVRRALRRMRADLHADGGHPAAADAIEGTLRTRAAPAAHA